MTKYSDRLAEKIVRLIEEDTYTIGEICDALKISRKTFYEWKSTKKEFRMAIEEAEYRRDEALAALARHSLREQLEGYITVTEKIVYEDDGWGGQKIKSKVVTKKKCAPNASILKLAIERDDRQREKKEAKNNSPENNPIVLKFPKNVDQEETTEIMKTFFHNARYGRESDKKATPETPDDENNYTSVVI